MFSLVEINKRIHYVSEQVLEPAINNSDDE